jgi:NDP-sugar pyrophosphorylase family protein
MSNTNEAMILVGGKGTRLRSVVNDRPKPMADVAGRPFVEWVLLHLRSQNIQHVIFCTGYMGNVIEAYFGDGRKWGIDIAYSREETLLGTAGAVRVALPLIKSERFLILNGDSYCNWDIHRLETAHIALGAQATLWLVHVENSNRFGSVELDETSSIRSFKEKSPDQQSGLINAGIYLVERRMVEAIPPGQHVSMETEVFPIMIDDGLCGVVGMGQFIDIGLPSSLSMAGRLFSSGFAE